MTPRGPWRDVGRLAVLATLGLCLADAALQYGGVDADTWQYLAAIIGLATTSAVFLRSRRQHTRVPFELWALTAVVAWMLLSIVPLPPGLVQLLSPYRAQLALRASDVTGSSPHAWLTLSVAPAATIERLLFVLPAAAVFVAAREMPLWWPGGRAWLAVAPVIGVGVFEALVGLAQFNGNTGGDGTLRSIAGTYVNRNHYAGLLEMGVPLALTGALALWLDTRPRRRPRHAAAGDRGIGVALRAGGLLLAASCLLGGVVASLSRMGFASTLVAIATVAIGWLVVGRRQARQSRWRWLIPLAIPLVIVLLVSTNGMILRFADSSNNGDITADGRMQIWSETLRLIAAYPVTGAGLGTFEHALYPFRVAMATSAVDYAHNDYLQILSELGIIGFVLTLELAGLIAWRCLGAASRASRQPWLGMGLLASLLALALHSVVDFNLYVPANALALAWLAGVAASPGLVSEAD